MLTTEQINSRIEEIQRTMTQLVSEQQQLIGYRAALSDIVNEKEKLDFAADTTKLEE